MSLSVGIVGLPNVGKSTLFKALTKKQAEISNYAFTTINPNIGVVGVPDERLNLLASTFNTEKIVPTTIEFVDIAGLIKGASEGEGLGNKFLANIREVDAVAHVVRAFEDSKINHVHEKIDPLNDIEIIETELALADMETKERRAQKEKKMNPKEKEGLSPLGLLMEKPIIYLLNVSEEQISKKWIPNPELLNKISNNVFVVLSARFELMISESTPEDSKLYLEELGLDEPGLNRLIKEAYKLLGLITFFSAGEKEARAWTTRKDTLIPKAASEIHTDFEKKFIKAEVVNWQDLCDSGSWAKAREQAKVRLVGRDYIVQEGDVVDIKI